jgi:Uma2 family endonuclease
MTADELLKLPTGMGQRYELVQGELKTRSPSGFKHGLLAARLALFLAQYSRAHHLGEVAGAETGFILEQNPDTVRAPDAAFVAAANIPPQGLPVGFFPGPPDLAVEVVSPNDTASEVQAKVASYLAAGSRQVWVVYPDLQQVAVFHSARESRILTVADTLDGGDLLPGFSLAVAELFA